MPDVDSLLEQLYSDAALRDDLRDDEAETLLRWAETQVDRLAAQSPDDATFEAQADQLRSLLKGVNHVVGERATLDDTTLQASMSQLAAEAQALGAPPTTTFSSQAATDLKSLDDATALETVLASLNLDATTQAVAPEETETPTAPAAPEPSDTAQTPPMPALTSGSPPMLALPGPSSEAPDAPDTSEPAPNQPEAPVQSYPGRTPLTLWPRRPSGDTDSHDETLDTEEDPD